jgi:hypothetical protein
MLHIFNNGDARKISEKNTIMDILIGEWNKEGEK